MHKIGDRVTITLNGVIEKLDGSLSDKKIRYTIKGYDHCTIATVLEHQIREDQLECDRCGRLFGINEMMSMPVPNGPDDIDHVPACKECYDYQLGRGN